MWIYKFGGINESFAVTIQQLNNDPIMINIGKYVNGYDIKSTPNPYILLDNVWIIDRDVIYRDNKLINANGIITGIPPDKNTPINIIKLKYANSTYKLYLKAVIF
jgi:hypothetical protein